MAELSSNLQQMKNETLPSSNGSVEESTIRGILEYLKKRDQLEDQWRETLFGGIQNKLFDGQDGERGEAGPMGPAGPAG
ncbi:TPA: peptidase, partial [Streptococcus pyogenes]